MTLAAALCVVAAVVSARSRRGRLRLERARQSLLPTPSTRQEKLTQRRSWAPAAAALVAASTMLLVGVGPAEVVGVGAVVATALVLRRRRGSRQSNGTLDVALCVDLIGAAMACGALPATALAAVAPAVPGRAGDALWQAATALSLGADPDAVWTGVAIAVPQLDRAARACARASSSGAGVADELFRLAAAARADTQVQRRRRLERAGVWLVLPLGLCFLPAFVLVAVVPVVLAAVPALAR